MKFRKLKDLFDVRDGTHDSPNYVDKDYEDSKVFITSKNIDKGEIDLQDCKYISPEDYLKIAKRSQVDKGDLLMPMIGTIGNPVISKLSDIAIKNVALVKQSSKNNIKIIFYLIQSNLFNSHIESSKRGGVVGFLSLGDFRNWKVPFPESKEEQKRIVDFLDKKTSLIDKKISLLEKKIELYEENKKKIIVESIMNNKGKKARIKDTLDFIKGKNFETIDERKEGYLPYLSMDYLRGRVEPYFVDLKQVRKVLIADSSDMALVWDGSNAGEIIELKEGVVSSTISVVKSKKDLNKKYIYYVLKSLEDSVRAESTGMGIPHVNGNSLRNKLIGLPKKEEQKRIVDFLDKKTSLIDKTIELTKKEISLQKEYKKTLINDVVTGKLEV